MSNLYFFLLVVTGAAAGETRAETPDRVFHLLVSTDFKEVRLTVDTNPLQVFAGREVFVETCGIASLTLDLGDATGTYADRDAVAVWTYSDPNCGLGLEEWRSDRLVLVEEFDGELYVRAVAELWRSTDGQFVLPPLDFLYAYRLERFLREVDYAEASYLRYEDLDQWLMAEYWGRPALPTARGLEFTHGLPVSELLTISEQGRVDWTDRRGIRLASSDEDE